MKNMTFSQHIVFTKHFPPWTGSTDHILRISPTPLRPQYIYFIFLLGLARRLTIQWELALRPNDHCAGPTWCIQKFYSGCYQWDSRVLQGMKADNWQILPSSLGLQFWFVQCLWEEWLPLIQKRAKHGAAIFQSLQIAAVRYLLIEHLRERQYIWCDYRGFCLYCKFHPNRTNVFQNWCILLLWYMYAPRCCLKSWVM